MKIIGIRLFKGASVVIKNLRPGWYPFGDYEEPRIDGDYKAPGWEDEINQVYQLYPKLPKVSVQCVVGKNGAGKTTLIDILLRLINNFAYCLLDGKADDVPEYQKEKGRELCYARGLYAKLFFEVDGGLGIIDCQDEYLSYWYRSPKSQKIYEYDKDSKNQHY